MDSHGNVYVADMNNFTIRKITPGGVVTTLAGLAGSLGSADGIGSAARFNYPYGIAVDPTGNVYVGDGGNNTVRKITRDGVVSTLAGSAGNPGSADGTGSAARFNSAYGGLAADSEGNLFYAEYGNNTVRKITSDGVVTTLAGTAGTSGSADGFGSAARFNEPCGVAVDGAGNVYVVDYGNSTIRKITSAGVVTALAGTAGAVGSADGTGGAARFDHPYGIAADHAGTVYVGDKGNLTIRKITSDGVVTTIAGTVGVAFAPPTGTTPSSAVDGTGVTAYFGQPSGMAIDQAGTLYVADVYNNAIKWGALYPPAMTALLLRPGPQGRTFVIRRLSPARSAISPPSVCLTG